jgi:hypothetical protein
MKRITSRIIEYAARECKLVTKYRLTTSHGSLCYSKHLISCSFSSVKKLKLFVVNHCNANLTSFNPAINYFKIGFDFDVLINSSLNAKRLILVKPMIKWSFSATLISSVDEA